MADKPRTAAPPPPPRAGVTGAAASFGTDFGEPRMCPAPRSASPIDAKTTGGYAMLSRREAARVDKAGGRDPAALQSVLQHPLFGEMTPAEQKKLLNVFAATNRAGREALPDLMSRRVPVGGGDPPPTAPALSSTDSGGRLSLLDHLEMMSTQRVRVSVNRRRGDLLAGVIQETGQPSFHLDQGDVGTCAPTTFSAHLMHGAPAEYARIIRGLAGPSRQVALADGSVLKHARGDTGRTVNRGGRRIADTRTMSERMFQSALVRRSLGKDIHAGSQRSATYVVDVPDLLGAIHGRRYAYVSTNVYAGVHRELNQGNGPVVANMNWGGGLHTVLVVGVRDGRVFFRNPWGSVESMGTSYTDGATMTNPARRVEDALSGIESMTVQAFRNNVHSAAL